VTPGVVLVIDRGDKLVPDDWRDPKLAEAASDDGIASVLSWLLDDSKLKSIADDSSPNGPTWIVVVPTRRLSDEYVSKAFGTLTQDQPLFARILTRQVTGYAEDEVRNSVSALRRVVLFSAIAMRNPALEPSAAQSLISEYTRDTGNATAARIASQLRGAKLIQ
jgi:hypothetical protein